MRERAVCTGRSIGDPSASPWRDDLRRGLEFAALDAGGEQPTVGDLPGAMDHGIAGQDHPQRAEERLREVETSQTEGVLDLLRGQRVAFELRLRTAVLAGAHTTRHVPG